MKHLTARQMRASAVMRLLIGAALLAGTALVAAGPAGHPRMRLDVVVAPAPSPTPQTSAPGAPAASGAVP